MSRLAIALALMGFVACATPSRPPPPPNAEPGELLFLGYATPQAECYTCHGADGHGTRKAPDLARQVPRMTRDELLDVLKHGSGRMPAYELKLTDAELDTLVDWLARQFPAK